MNMRPTTNSLQITLILIVIGSTHAYVFGHKLIALIDSNIINNERFTYFYKCQAAGRFINTALKLHIPLKNIPPHPVTYKNVKFLLFTRKNPKIPEKFCIDESIKSIQSNINLKKNSVFYVHGFNQTYDEGAEMFTKYLLPREDINIFIVNWDSYAFFEKYYSRNITTPRLGKILANFLHLLINSGADPKKIHLVGFSTGGQVVGLAAKEIHPKIARITAFDQEGSCFNFLPSSQRLAKTDADYVQIVRCTVGEFATRLDILGDVTFYMNNALIQPQCRNQTTIKDLNLCSHRDCREYLYDSLKKRCTLTGVKSGSYSNYLQSNCDCADKISLTYKVPTSVKGVYHVSTNPLKQLCPAK